ncbi:hypothetical protein [Prauserella endophytica]|uniref:LppX_LprAFG lipoprotein n=1 Tax=Prauserella endophytica TaxID=1592324 RepID=A0ABY2SAW8_9PSEU|nr:hypothetical protein [Prauserella endophytica]TKG72831.1 hypothetical protein FCN18_06315 [Prauserella endophytica]
MGRRLFAAGVMAMALTVSGCAQEIGGTAGGADDRVQSLVRAAEQSAAEFESARFFLNMDVGAMSMTGEGSGTFAGKDIAMEMVATMDLTSMGGESYTYELRMLGETLYLRMPPELAGPAGLPTDKPWVSASYEDFVGLQLDMDRMLETSDPTKQLELLAGSGEILDVEHNQKVDGRDTTKYVIDVDYEQLLEHQGMAADPALLPEGVELGRVPVSVWIDGRDLPLLIEMDMRDAIARVAGEEEPGMFVSDALLSMKYYDWGAPVSVEEPPADQVGALPAK